MKNKHKPDSLAAFTARRVPAARHGGDSLPPRPKGPELEAAIEELLDDLPEDFDEAKEVGARVAVAWRVARVIAESRGFVEHDDPLASVPVEAWSDPSASSYVQGQRAGAEATWRTTIERAQVALLPTAESREAFADVLWTVAVRLDVLGSFDGRLGALSLLALLEDGDDGYPDREAVLALEDALVGFTIATATVSPETEDEDSEVASIHKARRRLTEDFQLAPSEVASLLSIAQHSAIQSMPTGDALRSMQLLGLEDLSRRAAGALDLSSEIAARRLFAQVSGVTRSVPEDAALDFLNVVRRVSARQDAIDEAREVAALPARRTEEVEPTIIERAPEDDEFDDDALREFDAENR